MKSITLESTALLLLAAPVMLHAAPVELGRESFEAAPGIGYTTSTAEFDEASVPTSDFFGKFPNDGARTRGVITGGDGSNVFMGEDLDAVAPVGPTQSLTTNAFSIAGKTNTSVKILLAAPGTGPSGTVLNGGHQNHYDWSATTADVDFVRVEASIDGGPFNRLIQFSPNTGTLHQPLTLDADGDYLGGGATTLNATFQEFDLPISSGNSVQVRVVMHTNATNEYIVVDNIRIFGETAATAPPSIAGVPGTALIFNEGSAAQTLAPALTVTDADSASLASAVVSISANHTSAEDVLAATPSGAILPGDIVFNSGAGTLTITRNASLADYQAVLRSVTYRNTNATSPNTGARQISFRVNDSANNSNQPIRVVEITDAITVQSVPFTESFETDGRGTRYALDGRFTTGPAFFDRVALSGVTNGDGTFGIAAEDTLVDAAPVKAASFLLNTAGLVNLTATVRLAAPGGNQGGNVYDSNDFIAIEASVNGGAFTTVGNFRSTGGLNTAMAQDTNSDNTGDGTVLTAAMQDFTFNLPAANTLGLRVRMQSNSAGERLVADRIVVTGTPVEFSINSVSGAENAGAMSFTVTRSISTGADTVNYAVTGGSAAPDDFTAASGTVSFADGETTRPISVSITPDNIVELDETFSVALSSPSRGAVAGGPGTGTITNDDSAVISLTGGTVTEGDSGTAAISFTVTLSNPVDAPITFNRATLASGTATSGTDFTAVSSTATFIAALSTTGNFSVNAIGDHVPESTETVPVELSSLSASGRSVTFTGGGATTTASGGILDDDPVIVAGTGGLSMGIGASGKTNIAALLAQATGGEGRPLSLASVQSGPTAGGGTVSIVDGWINYQPAPGFSGADSFTYTISDGFQTVTGTVNVVASNGIGQTVNILSITPQGAGNALVALGIPGRTYRWQTSSNLTTWTNLGSSVVCPGSGVISHTDPGPLPPTRFYRMVQP